MGLLDDVLRSDSLAFVDSDVFGESVTLVLPTGATRSVSAVVDRNVPIELSDGAFKPGTTATLRNDSTYGIAWSELSVGGNWKMRVALKLGGATADHPIHRITSGDPGDAGMITVAVG